MADEWIAPKPHTDFALVLAIVHEVITSGRYDRAFVKLWVLGFDELRERSPTPSSVVHFAGVTHWTYTGEQLNGIRLVQIHPDTARRYRIDNGDTIIVESHTETDLRTPMRDGADDDHLARLWAQTMYAKPAGHGMDQPEFRQPDRTMSAIGG